jgi:hypothetical protein
MDDNDYLRVLEAHDDLRLWYCPADFDYEAAERHFLDFARELQEALGVECWVRSGSAVQDASFLGDIDLPPDCFNVPERANDPVFLRVSNWGNLATVSDEAAIEPDWLEQIKALLDRFGYQYIPPSVLQRPYRRLRLRDLPPFYRNEPRMTWWIRYFDWI